MEFGALNPTEATFIGPPRLDTERVWSLRSVRMPFASALSEHPDPAEAAGEVISQVVDTIGGEPDLVFVFVTPPHRDAFDDVAATVRRALRPHSLVGATAVWVVGGTREVEETPAMSLWVGRFGEATSVRVEAVESSEGRAFTGLPDPMPRPATLVLVADPASFPTDSFLAYAAEHRPELTIIGGVASAGGPTGGDRLALDGSTYADGAVGVLVHDRSLVEPVLSQGCRPIGTPLVVTAADRNIVYELAGRPALDRLRDLAAALDEHERSLVQEGLHLGRVIDERREEFGRGDFLVRNVLGVDSESGAIAVSDVAEVGSTVQFQVRDATSADEDLRELMADATAEAALVFTCNGRGTRLFGSPDHDATVIHDALDGVPVAGMACAGEIGPVGTKNFLHGFTASVALFRKG